MPEEVKNHEINYFLIYCEEIKENKVLSAEEEIVLYSNIKSNNPALVKKSNDEFVKANLKLVVSRVNKICPNLKDHHKYELVQHANVEGLLKAIENFNPEKGRFSTYAVPYIDGAIKRRRDELFNISSNWLMMKRLYEEFQHQNNRKPDYVELIDHFVRENAVKYYKNNNKLPDNNTLHKYRKNAIKLLAEKDIHTLSLSIDSRTKNKNGEDGRTLGETISDNRQDEN